MKTSPLKALLDSYWTFRLFLLSGDPVRSSHLQMPPPPVPSASTARLSSCGPAPAAARGARWRRGPGGRCRNTSGGCATEWMSWAGSERMPKVATKALTGESESRWIMIQLINDGLISPKLSHVSRLTIDSWIPFALQPWITWIH